MGVTPLTGRISGPNEKRIDITGLGMDGYGQVMDLIALNIKSVSLEMVKAALTEVQYSNCPHAFECRSYLVAEREAQSRTENSRR
jgi:hypothetical protein